MSNRDEYKLRLPSSAIYEIISKEGEEEIERSFQALAWSAVVAGFCISFSLLCEGFLRFYLPDDQAYTLLCKLGYSVGFLLVILGRFQLFTENTITVMLPLFERMNRRWFLRSMRIWLIVMIFNFLGTFIVALCISHGSYMSTEQMNILIDISKHATDGTFKELLVLGIPAGFLISTLVWMMPSSNGAQFWVILMVTYVIAIGGFTHIVAGSAEAFLLVLTDHISPLQCLQFLLAVALGNIIGGTGLFALMAYAQVREEI